MRPIIWSSAATEDFESQISYIAADNPPAASAVAGRVRRAVEGLGFMPTGRPGRVSGTYEKVVRGAPYIVAYALDLRAGEECIIILRVIHASRNWPPEGWPAR